MPKITNVRERVHQPFRDSLVRTAGMGMRAGTARVEDTNDLFMATNKNRGETNLPQGSVLPSDQSMVVLCLRAFAWFRNPIERGGDVTLADAVSTMLASNGDFALPDAANSPAFANALNGQAIGTAQDVLRLYWQTAESLFWSFGAGDKFSITSMPTAYFPYGGGLHGQLGNQSDLILFNNGMPSHEGILRLARAILIPPRQNIKCQANIVSYDDGNNSQTFGATQGWRNMLSLRDNLMAVDLIAKVVTFTFDGLFSRDVQ